MLVAGLALLFRGIGPENDDKPYVLDVDWGGRARKSDGTVGLDEVGKFSVPLGEGAGWLSGKMALACGGKKAKRKFWGLGGKRDGGGAEGDCPCVRFLFEVEGQGEGEDGGRRRLLGDDEDVWLPLAFDDDVKAKGAGGGSVGKGKKLREIAFDESRRGGLTKEEELALRLSTVRWASGIVAGDADGGEGSTSPESDRPRRRLDTFGDSVVHVNQLYHKAFGVKQRKVPAHMPHMINSDVVEEMQRMWPEEWERTSRNKFRSGDDMQYGFSYFYYLTYRRELHLGLNKGEKVFYDSEAKADLIRMVWEDEIDTDGDGVLSNNEVRDFKRAKGGGRFSSLTLQLSAPRLSF